MFPQSMKLDALLQQIQSVQMEEKTEVWDSILAQCYQIFFKAQEKDTAKKYISQMKAAEGRITCLISTGQLRDAYIMAIKAQNTVRHVLRIKTAAQERDNKNTLKKCEDWLQRYAPQALSK